MKSEEDGSGWRPEEPAQTGIVELPSREEIAEAMKLMDVNGVDRPIMEGLPTVDPDASHALEECKTDEERELPGTRRLRRGAGWWGRDDPRSTYKKGVSHPFADGAGHMSPGRWRIDRRRLPDNGLAR